MLFRSGSQEFHVIADTGEDAIVYCPNSDYAANLEAAESLSLIPRRDAPKATMNKVATPSQKRCEDVSEFLKIPLTQTVKSLVLAVDQASGLAKLFMLLLRGDHELNEIKVNKVPGLSAFRFASDEEIKANCGSPVGYLGPVGLGSDITVIADRTVANMSDFVCGANTEGYHLTGVNWARDLPEPIEIGRAHV